MNPSFHISARQARRLAISLSMVLTGLFITQVCQAAPEAAQWEQCGWGGGGFYVSAAMHPTKDGVIYLGGDVNGVSRSDDHGRTFKMINNGIVDYGVFSLAVDKSSPDTVYAATAGGLCKSTDRGEHWRLLPLTVPGKLHITGERNRSIRSVAVSPTDSNVVYAASQTGKLYKSMDGGETWTVSYEDAIDKVEPGALRVQYGKVDGQFYGGMWTMLKTPVNQKPEQFIGIGFSFKGDGSKADRTFMTITTADGLKYTSRNISEIFTHIEWKDVMLKTADFTVDPDYAKNNPDKVAKLPANPQWSSVNRIDFTLVGPLPTSANIALFKRFFLIGSAAAGKQDLVTVRDFAADPVVQSYGNIRTGQPTPGAIYSVAVSQKDPTLVITATSDSGLVLSQDAGKSWKALKTPKRASSAMFSPDNPSVIYGTFFNEGVWKSTDRGNSWVDLSAGLGEKFDAWEVAVSPANPLDIHLVGSRGWTGFYYRSHDGGKTWKSNTVVAVDVEGDPTLNRDSDTKTALSSSTNIALSHTNPKELYISANWRSAYSEDGGITLTERDRGADMSCISDIRFSGNRTYTVAMDEGVFVSENSGKQWRQLWPLKYTTDMSGHCWRLSITSINSVDHIVSTFSPWENSPKSNVVVLSDDGGKTHQIIKSGLPNYMPIANTMWGEGYMRALAVDPANPQILYAGIDGDPEDGKTGGGIFKTEDGGHNWKQLPHQPGSRRMYYGLAVDPTDSKRIYWTACGNNGGIWITEDGGESWKNVFSNDAWLWNVVVTKTGVAYAAGSNIWKSIDHGKSWTQLTKFTDGRPIVGLEVDPRDPKTVWISVVSWDGSSNGAVFKTTDDGVTWQDITGNIPCKKPQILRFNPVTNELWAGNVGLYKIKQ